MDSLSPTPPVEAGQASIDGMKVTWYREGSFWVFETTAQTEGWVAVGFNIQNDIVGSNLIMGSVADGVPRLADHFVVGVGDHQPVAQLGGTSQVELLKASEKDGQTMIRFRIAADARDEFHYDLRSGSSIYLILAYSVDDDFDHHSRLRQHVQVTL
ncbi:MAG: DOMON domain-containing protein [Chloroflexota bacterium]